MTNEAIGWFGGVSAPPSDRLFELVREERRYELLIERIEAALGDARRELAWVQHQRRTLMDQRSDAAAALASAEEFDIFG